ncbi:MAG: diaminopimelate epimerase [Verrucomicrobia bacterium]|nr:diaminopimelate epimerase [Verrucomicrobiota bacterium]
MNGAGNDFVLVDNRAHTLSLTPQQVVRLCHRQKGIGADGLILLESCRSGKADWAWQFFNNDGSTAEMCGNGARCFARFVQRLTGQPGPITFETTAGVIRAQPQGDRVTIDLTDPKDLELDQQVEVSTGILTVHSLNTGVPHAVIFVPNADKAMVTVHSLNTGVPHAVIFVPNADKAMVQRLGSEVRHHQMFAPKGTNVNFAQSLGPSSIRVRTYERGVEGETLACGTGVTASALIAARVHRFASPVRVQVQSGDDLEVSFKETGPRFESVTLTGSAEFVFEGRLALV